MSTKNEVETKKVLDRTSRKLALMRKYPCFAPTTVYQSDGYHFSVWIESPVDKLSDEEIDRLLKA